MLFQLSPVNTKLTILRGLHGRIPSRYYPYRAHLLYLVVWSLWHRCPIGQEELEISKKIKLDSECLEVSESNEHKFLHSFWSQHHIIHITIHNDWFNDASNNACEYPILLYMYIVQVYFHSQLKLNLTRKIFIWKEKFHNWLNNWHN